MTLHFNKLIFLDTNQFDFMLGLSTHLSENKVLLTIAIRDLKIHYLAPMSYKQTWQSTSFCCILFELKWLGQGFCFLTLTFLILYAYYTIICSNLSCFTSSTNPSNILLLIHFNTAIRPGQCPVNIPGDDFSPCTEDCRGDSDCPANLKCCSRQCGGTICVPPSMGWI